MASNSTISSTTQTSTCFHCGEVCVEETLVIEDKSFCCTGCKLVYEVLSENDLCSYYAMEGTPGANQKNLSNRQNRFDYLEDADIIKQLVDFQNKHEIHVAFTIPFIHCASCVWLLENLHRINPGIIQGRVDYIKKTVQIKFLNEVVTLKEVVQLLAKIGYEPSINLADTGEKKKSNSNKNLLLKLGVAGFCFGNMMLFSLPEYFSEAELMGQGFKKTFNYLNVLLALPVFFYAATDYYRSAWYAIRNGSINMDVPIALGIFTLFGYSLYDIFMLGQEGYMDTLGGLLFFLLIGKYYQQKTYETLAFDRDYKSYFPIAVTRLVKDQEEVIPLDKLEEGNLIKVRSMELIPADSILVSGAAYIDYSFVTGEEVPVPLAKGELIYAGGRQKGDAISLLVKKLPSQGYLTDLWNHESFAKEKPASLESLSNQISGKFTFTVVLIAFAAMIFWMGRGEYSVAVLSFTSVLIITCPCALAMSTPFSLGNTLRIFGLEKFYLKNAQVIEKLAQIDTIVFDKTGTLTAPSDASVTYFGTPLNEESNQILKAMVGQSTHALSHRISTFLNGTVNAPLESRIEIQGQGIKAFYQGQELKLGSGQFTGVSMPQMVLRGNLVFFTQGGGPVGYFYIQSGLRKGITEVIQTLKSNHSVHVLSGDQDHERHYLSTQFGSDVAMKFNQHPADKLNYIKTLNLGDLKTLMIGDGLNDAGALQESHVGIALTDTISNFSPASDAIMDASVIQKLPAFIAFAKTTRNIIKASFGLSFSYNLVGVFFAVQGLVSPVFCAILMPISSLSVIVFTTVSTNYLAYRKGLKSKIF